MRRSLGRKRKSKKKEGLGFELDRCISLPVNLRLTDFKMGSNRRRKCTFREITQAKSYIGEYWTPARNSLHRVLPGSAAAAAAADP